MAHQVITIPYCADPDSLARPLPSKEEIQNSPQLSGDQSTHKVARVDDYFVVKYGPQVDVLEGENMMFTRPNTSVRVPKVYAMYANPTNNK